MHHRLDQTCARFPRHLTHHSEIQVAEPTISESQQISRVGIGMEEAVFQKLLQAAVHPDRHHVIGIDAQLSHRFEVGELDAVDPLHRQHPSTGGFPVDVRNGDAGVLLMELAEFLGIRGFIQVVHFLKHPTAQFINQGDEIAANQTDVAVEPGGDVAHDVEIKGDLFAQTRPLNFHGNALTIVQCSSMHLAEGGSGDRFAFQFRIDAADRSAEVLFDAGHGQIAVESRKLVLQLSQFLQQNRRHDVRSRGQSLSGLDEGWSQFHEQFRTFPCSASSPLRIFEQLEDPIKSDPDQQHSDRHQCLPQTTQQSLGMTRINTGDGCRVIGQ